MAVKPIINQMAVENETLEHIKDALLATLAWPVEGETFTRKLSSVRFATRWFAEQLDRLFAIEEHDGYMTVVIDQCPHLSGKVESLRREHQELRQEVRCLMPQLERVLPTDHQRLEWISEQLQRLVSRLDRHTQQENALIQEALLREEGICD